MTRNSIGPTIQWLLLGLGLCFGIASPAEAERRVALVLGNDAYETVDRLEKAVNDSRTIAATLAAVGFEVVRAENVTRRELNRTLVDFTARLERGDVALFFYAGHGVEIEGRNYLLPTDIPAGQPGDEQFVRSEAVAVDEVLDAIHRTGARVTIMIIDACRDNPFARKGTRSLGGTRGLARMAPSAGTFVMYSAGVGQTALDRLDAADPNPNSVFTRSLAPLLAEPGLTLTETARRVRRRVEELARAVSHDQRPAYYDEVSGDFYLAGRGPETGTAAPPRPAPPFVPAPPQVDPAAVAWDVTKDTTSPAVLKVFIAQFPGTVYAALAKARLDELEAEAAVAPTPPPPVAVAPAPQTISLAYPVGLDPRGDNWLALKAAPDIRSKRLAKMGPDTLLSVIERRGDWLKVEVRNTALAGYIGWAAARYVACCREVPVR